MNTELSTAERLLRESFVERSLAEEEAAFRESLAASGMTSEQVEREVESARSQIGVWRDQ